MQLADAVALLKTGADPVDESSGRAVEWAPGFSGESVGNAPRGICEVFTTRVQDTYDDGVFGRFILRATRCGLS